MELNYFVAENVRGLTGLSSSLDSFWIFTAETGAYIIPITLVVLFLLGGRNREDSLFIFFTTLLGIGMAHFIQQLYIHPRPFEIYGTLLADATGDSFPSQHASTLFPFSLAFLYRGRKKLGLIFLTWAMLNTFSRVVVGYHFPIDIITGLIIGTLVVWAMGQHPKPTERLSKLTEKFERKILSQFTIKS